MEIATDPDYSGEDIDESEVTPGSQLLLQISCKVALGNDDEAWELYRQFIDSNK